jgi:hypothetical protein
MDNLIMLFFSEICQRKPWKFARHVAFLQQARRGGFCCHFETSGTAHHVASDDVS